MPTPHFVYDLPELTCSEASFAPHIPVGKAWQTTVTLHSSDGRRFNGSISSDDRRIIPASDRFSGTNPEITFGIDTKGLRVDDEIVGHLEICSDLGEMILPVHAVIVEAPDEDFDPEIRALEDFEQLCKRNMREGFRLFTHPAFPHILNGKNVIYLPLYRGLSRNPVTYQHLEEFLISSGKKEPILLSLDKQQKAVYHLDASQKDTLYIYKNNWGYIHVAIDVEGDFLEIDRDDLTSEDFIGDICGLKYVVHRDRIGNGRAFGRIILRTVHQELVYEIEASAKEESQIQPRAVRSRRISWLMRDFLKLQLHELDYRTWQDSSAMTVGELLEEDPSDIWAILYATYLRYTQDDNAKAIETLWPLKEGALIADTIEKKAVYLWLSKKIGLLPQEARDIRPTLQRYYEKKPKSYLLLYLLHQEAEDQPIIPAVRLKELEGCFDAGCISPFLYLSAWEQLQKEEALLRDLSPFLIQVLCFGQKQGRMTAGLLKRTAVLSAGMKHYSNALFRLLTEGYKSMPDDGILEAICQLLVKGDPIRKECFPWYARAVDRNIRMTRLYEYYMETYDRPAEDEIPQPVRMYFATNNTLGASKRALLYASVILHQDKEPTDYMNYARNMRAHALDSLQKGKIDRNYAILYKHFFAKPDTPEIAELLTRVLFVQRIHVLDKDIRQVAVCHNALKKETVYPCRDGVAYPRIYSEDACLLFEDDQHRRFATTVQYAKEPMFAARDIAQACMYQAIDDPGLELYLCHEKAFQMDVNSRTIGDYQMAEKNPAFTDAYRRIVRRKLLEYALEHPEQEGTVLPADKIAFYAEADRAAAEELLIREGRYEEAFRVISEYGFENVPVDRLKELAEKMIEAADGAFDEELLYLSAHIFAEGKENETILTYLRDYYEGPLDSLSHLWERVYGAGIDPILLEEKILQTAVRVRKIPEHATEILSDRIDRGGDLATPDNYLTFLAGQYFLGGRVLDVTTFAHMEEALREGRLAEDICKLAVLKHDAEAESLTEEQRMRVAALLKEENGKGYRFAFYQQFPADLTEGIQMEDKIVIEEQFRPDSRVILRYQIIGNGETEGEWISEPMPQVYDGIFHQEFQLFYGDTLRYDLRVMTKGKIENTEIRTITVSADEKARTRYALLNRMRKAEQEGDQQALADLAREYATQQEAAGRVLELIRESGRGEARDYE